MAKDAKGHGSEKRDGGGGETSLRDRLANHSGYQAALKKAQDFGNATITPHATPLDVIRANAHLTDQQAAAALAQGGAKSAPVDVHPGAAGRSDGPLSGMTQAKWSNMTPGERERVRDNSALTPQLKGLEGHRVEATTNYGETRRFIVGKSTGWQPIHLEIARRNSSGGGGASKSYKNVRSLGKVR